MVISNLDKRQTDYTEQARQLLNEPDTAIILLGTEFFAKIFVKNIK